MQGAQLRAIIDSKISSTDSGMQTVDHGFVGHFDDRSQWACPM